MWRFTRSTMTKSLLTIISITLLATQFALADCETSNIPGHYIGRYVDNNDGTILDKMTKLTWMKCDVDIPWDAENKKCLYPTDVLGGGTGRISYTWQEALIAANNININGFAENREWRLPNIKELTSILELNCLSLNGTNGAYAINTNFFDIDSSIYWSSTPHAEAFNPKDGNPYVNQAWNVTYRGNSSNIGAIFSQITEKYHVRLVRDFN